MTRTSWRQLAAIASGCSLLASCMMGPDYKRPAIDAPAAYLSEPAQFAAAADLDWWKQFGDPVLDQLIAEALANNRSIQIAAANVRQAAGVVTTTRAPLFPQVNYQGAATRARIPPSTEALPSTVGNPFNVYDVLGGASWEIDLWGRIRRQTESAQADLLATEQARRGVVLSLVASVATDYLALRGYDEQLVKASESLNTYGQSLEQMELKFKYGRVNQMNVEQARSRYETAAAQIPQIRQAIAQQEYALSILLARNPGAIARGKPLLDIALPLVPAGVPSELLERRPDLLQAEQQLVAANAQIGAAKALYFPTISLTAAFGGASTELGDLFKGSSRRWNFGGSIVGPIFTAGAISGQVAQAQAAQDAALLNYQQAVQSAFADVDTSLSARVQLIEQSVAQERLVTALREYQRYARMLFDGGRADYSTVLQAEEQLFPAELNYATARAQTLISVVNIYKTMGGGWVDAADRLSVGQARADAATGSSPR